MKKYIEVVEEKDKFITYAYFTRVWKKQFNVVYIPKKSRMGICNICSFLKERREKSEGEERGMTIQNCCMDAVQMLYDFCATSFPAL